MGVVLDGRTLVVNAEMSGKDTEWQTVPRCRYWPRRALPEPWRRIDRAQDGGRQSSMPRGISALPGKAESSAHYRALNKCFST